MNQLRPILLVLTAVAALPVTYPAKANTITTFDISGTCTPNAPLTGTSFGGTITIDVTAGEVTAIDLSFQGLGAFNTILQSLPGASEWFVQSRNGSRAMRLTFSTGPALLVGFTGGTISGESVEDLALGTTLYTIQGGSITAPAGVPDAGSTLSLLSFALLGVAVLRRKLRC